MRKKVTDYLSKPTKKLYEELTSMEQKFVDAQKDAQKDATKKP